MAVACPSCGRLIAIMDAKPGRFKITCPECARPFGLSVGAGPDPEIVARALEAPAPLEPSRDASAIVKTWLTGVGGAIAERAGWAWRAATRRGSVVGGALLLEEPARTSIGMVARARQVWLGRDVMVRLLPADWAGPDAVSLASATRLEYAARQVIHPNLSRRLSAGTDRGRRYSIEESARGTRLAELASRADARAASTVPILLHAARGLLAAHDLGLAHGDPSADHIRVDPAGLVSLAGIGLGSRPTEDREASVTDVILDVRSLGFTLQTLVAGRKDSDQTLSVIAGRMVAAGTAEGFRDLAEVVRALESALGLTSVEPGIGAGAAPSEAGLRDIAERYRNVPLATLRSTLILGFIAVIVLVILLGAKARNWSLAGAGLGLGALTAAAYSVLSTGLGGRRSDLFDRGRELILGGRRSDWLTLAAVVALAVGVVVALGWMPGVVAIGVAALVFAAGFRLGIDVPIARDRDASLTEAREWIASSRGRGVSEPAIRAAVHRAGESRGDGLFEALFGLEETRLVRLGSFGSTMGPRFRLDGWRFALFGWLDARLRDRDEARARARFEPIEETAQVARKVNEMTARRRSRRIAEALIIVGREVRVASLAAMLPAGQSIRVLPRPVPDLLREAVETPDRLLTSTWSDDRDPDRDRDGPNLLLRALAGAVGPRVRFLLGGLLVAAFLLWADQVGVISSRDIRATIDQAISDRAVEPLGGVNVDLNLARQADEALVIPGVPPALTRLVTGPGVGAAGLILLASSFVAGWRIALFAIPGAAIAWFGPRWGVPGVGSFSASTVSTAIGASALAVGIFVRGRLR